MPTVTTATTSRTGERFRKLQRKHAFDSLVTDKHMDLRFGLEAKSAYDALSADHQQAFRNISTFIKAIRKVGERAAKRAGLLEVTIGGVDERTSKLAASKRT